MSSDSEPRNVSGDNRFKIVIKWSGNEYAIEDWQEEETISDLKEKLYQKTGVKPERQKLMGLKVKNGSILSP